MKILIIDDDRQVIDALSVAIPLQWQGVEIITALDGDEGIDKFFECEPDLVLLDVSLPRRSGFEILQAIRRVSDVPIILITARDGETDQVRGLELGADDYVIKPFSQLTLLARMRAILRRAELPPPVWAIPSFVAGDLAINFESHQVSLKGRPVKLTPVEYKLLYHLVRNAGRLLPHQALLDRVWGEDYGATTDHLKVFISRLRAKLEAPSGQRFIETERGLGYRFVQPRPAEKVAITA